MTSHVLSAPAKVIETDCSAFRFFYVDCTWGVGFALFCQFLSVNRKNTEELTLEEVTQSSKKNSNVKFGIRTSDAPQPHHDVESNTIEKATSQPN